MLFPVENGEPLRDDSDGDDEDEEGADSPSTPSPL